MKQANHKKWNISYDLIEAKAIENLNNQQAEAFATHINELRRQLAEASFLLDSHENGWSVPDTIENDYKTVEID